MGRGRAHAASIALFGWAMLAPNGRHRRASPISCFRCGRSQRCFGANSWPRWRRRAKTARSGAIRRARRQLGASGNASFTDTIGWSMPGRPWLARRRACPAKAGVLAYSSRYTRRTAIGNQRIRASRAAKAWRSRCAPTSPPLCAGAALACQRRGRQPIICPVSRP